MQTLTHYVLGLVVLLALFSQPVLGKVSAADVQLARAYGYSEKLIDRGLRLTPKPLSGCSDPKNVDFFSRYRTFDEIEDFLQNRLCDLRQEIGSVGSQCELFVIGKSVEGRPIYAVEIRNPEALAEANLEGRKEKAVLMTGTLHAREWTTTTTALLNAVRLDVTDISLLIVPVWNPDGYVFSWTSEKPIKRGFLKGKINVNTSYARFWRKNRKLNHDGSYGVDLNRNFGSSNKIWGTDTKSKSIFMTESDVYQGESGFSEPETQTIRDYHAKYKNQIISFVDIHCCIGTILEPFAPTEARKAPTYVYDIGMSMIDAINTKTPLDKPYTWRNRPASSAGGSGISSSWAYQEAGIQFTYVIELRGKFQTACTEIKPIGNEFVEGMRALLKELSHFDKTYKDDYPLNPARGMRPVTTSENKINAVEEIDDYQVTGRMVHSEIPARAMYLFFLGFVAAIGGAYL
eukprot:CAMPEP_0184508108 /NCGR_PEP_ID=MMETSP0198_2-20121128/589_1 /TAXON_ID=1112570 /ORGANISM="Thraustochytrium sp., Strain LLF1b" /LENGTH=459 /DNA_ID=CAMNT_0026897879 /DNA_START=218 /DNA_END=1594 /DNA_ORIENTATION=-